MSVPEGYMYTRSFCNWILEEMINQSRGTFGCAYSCGMIDQAWLRGDIDYGTKKELTHLVLARAGYPREA